jgi:Zn-dependent M28 family amino/carboxypeptidase
VVAQPFIVDQGDVRNIIASFGPESGPRVVIGAHYDVAGNQPGADDNASGVSGLLELARLLSTDSAKLPMRIDLVAYTLEEPPYFRTKHMGSWIHAKSLKDSSVDVRIMLSIEMIGYFRDSEDSQRYPSKILGWFYPSKGNFISVVSNFGSHFASSSFVSLMKEGCGVPIERLTAPASIPGVDFSDHLNYWECGFDAAMITDTSFLRNDNYHETTDTPESLDYARMAEVVNGVYHAATHMSP